MIKLVEITEDNIKMALEIEHKIFPKYNARANYYDSLKSDKITFFLLFTNNEYIGISGVYSYENDHENAWLGFFGLKEEYRGKGFGKEALELTENYAIERGFKFMRLFTDKYDNMEAIDFYRSQGYTFENYDCKQEDLRGMFQVVIGSKSISDLKVKKWNNKFLNITKQTIKQEC